MIYCKYYEVVYILFHTGMRISELCGLTLKDIDLENRTVNIDYQLQRTCDMQYIIEETKTEAGKRKIPITEDVAQMFQSIIEDREPPKLEEVIDGYTGFLFYDDDGNPLGSTDSIEWLEDIMIFTECRCRTSHLMYAAILIVPIWQNRG